MDDPGYDSRMSLPTIPLAEFATRRQKLRTGLRKSVGLVFAGDHADHLHGNFRPHRHFEYLTGITDEPGAVLLLDPVHAVPARREVLFLRPLNPELEQWDGHRLSIGQALRDRVGIKTVFRLNQLPRLLSEAVRRHRSVACLHPPATYDQPIPPDLAIFRKLLERLPGLEIADRSEELVDQRAVKSKAEIAMVQQAIDITALGFEAVMKESVAGLNEFVLQERLEHTYREHGSRGPAFGTIVGAGLNSTVLHYRSNDQTIEESDLICIDSGAAFGGYGADITRTIPASGRFSKRQREVYQVVLSAQEAAIKAIKPGVRLAEVDSVARAIISKAGFGDKFIHSIGHHLGLDTHDVSPDGPLREGNLVTVEPGIYLPDEGFGIRIEDDVLVTKTGHRNLSAKIPKSAAAVEKAMRGGA